MSIVNPSEYLATLSRWIDEHPPNANASVNEQLWARCGKIAEEFGEVIGELILYTGQNPRKPQGSGLDLIRKELLDVAVTALAAVEHVNGNDATSLDHLMSHIVFLTDRAGLLK